MNMKVLAIVILLVAGSFEQIIISGPRCPLPAEYIGTEGPLNITLHPILEIHEGGTHGVSTTLGLNTYSYEYNFPTLVLTYNFNITVGDVSLDTIYTATGYLDARPFSAGCIPSGNFSGEGTAKADVDGFRAIGTAAIFVNIITDRVSLRLLAVSSLSFASITVDLGPNYVIGGAPVDWPSFNANLKGCFDAEFSTNSAAVAEKIRLAINEKIDDYTSEEFFNLIGGGDSTCPPQKMSSF